MREWHRSPLIGAPDPYVFELIRPEGYGGHVTEREYANDYYGDFFNYTRTKNPEVWGCSP